MKNEIVFSLRIEENMYEEIKKIAEEEQRSINKQIIYMLMSYLVENEEEK